MRWRILLNLYHLSLQQLRCLTSKSSDRQLFILLYRLYSAEMIFMKFFFLELLLVVMIIVLEYGAWKVSYSELALVLLNER